MINPKREALLHRSREILELRDAGATCAEISALLDVPDEIVRRAIVGDASDKLSSVTDLIREKHRRVQLDRLEDVLLAHLPDALNSKSKSSARAADVVIKVLTRQAALLGLDEPRRSEVDQVVTRRDEPELSTYSIAELEVVVRALDVARSRDAVDVTPRIASVSNGKSNGHA